MGAFFEVRGACSSTRPPRMTFGELATTSASGSSWGAARSVVGAFFEVDGDMSFGFVGFEGGFCSPPAFISPRPAAVPAWGALETEKKNSRRRPLAPSSLPNF